MKIFKKLFALTLAVLSCAILFTACDQEKKPSTNGDETQTEQGAKNENVATSATTINALLEGKSGEISISVQTLTRLKTSSAQTLTLGSSALEKVIIDGGANGAMLEFTGAGASAVQLHENATLVFKNLTFKDDTSVASQGHSAGYIKFGGKLRFENCKIYDGVALKNDANAEFENCSFLSSNPSKYAAWVSAGNVSFKNCSFTGARGIKIHEELNFDVISVVIDGCRFDNLTKKPALAIGDICIDPANTKISIKNCTISECGAWDNVGSLEGIDGLYEAHTLTSAFEFIQENNRIN